MPRADSLGFSGGLRHRRRDGVAVVLDEEAQRQLPRRGQVHRLQHRADVDRAVTKVADGEVGGARVLLRPGVAGRHRDTAADDRVGAERAGLQPLQVHRPAPAGAVALGQAEDLGEGALQDLLHLRRHQGRQVEAALGDVGDGLREELVVAPVRAIDRVGRAQGHDGADRAALLADAGVRRAMHEAFAGQFQDRLLEGPDEVQLAEHGGEQARVRCLPVGRRGGELAPLGTWLQALNPRHVRLP